MNEKNLEKINIKKKIVINIYNVLLHQISVNLENFSFWDQICPQNTVG